MRFAIALALSVGLSVGFAGCAPVDFVAREGTVITISANPLEISLQGGTSKITASLQAASGLPVADGTVVRFTTTLGEVTAQTETKDGLAFATLSSTGIGGTAEVIAFSGSADAPAVSVTIGVTTSALSLTATPASLPTTGGSVDLVAALFGENGSPVPNATVTFSTTEGSLSSGGNPITTDSDGVATDTLVTSRTADVTARAGTESQTVTVSVGNTGANTVVLSADQVNLPSGGGTTGLVAVVLGDTGPVSGVPVAWSADAGQLGTIGTTVTDSSGKAFNSLFTTIQSVVTVAASGINDALTITVGTQPQAVLSVTSNRSSIPPLDSTVFNGDCATAGNMFPIKLQAQLEDDSGNPIASRPVTFFIDFDNISGCGRAFGVFCTSGTSSAIATTDSAGVASVDFIMTATDINFCNCNPNTCLVPPATGPGVCFDAAGCASKCNSTDDLFCQVAINAVSQGTLSTNIQFIEYSR